MTNMLTHILNRIKDYWLKERLTQEEVIDLIDNQVQYIQSLDFWSTDIGLSENDIQSLLDWYVYEWMFDGTTFCIYNCEYDISWRDNNRASIIENIKKKAIATWSYISWDLNYNELINASNELALVINNNTRPKYVYVDFTDDDLTCLKNWDSFEWNFLGIRINLFNEEL